MGFSGRKPTKPIGPLPSGFTPGSLPPGVPRGILVLPRVNGPFPPFMVEAKPRSYCGARPEPNDVLAMAIRCRSCGAPRP